MGQALYRENCAVCHDIEQAQSKKLGPSFYQLFRREKMPIASMKPNRDYIKVRVKFGGQLMPAFRQRLSGGTNRYPDRLYRLEVAATGSGIR